MSDIATGLFAAIKKRLSLYGYLSREKEIVAELRTGAEFGSLQLWILIFAIFIASIGLNVNSTAVVIGAMLISPLMGPIMGIGLGVGISDIHLIKKAAVNLGIMVFASISTSALYFFISPFQEAQSELLARTTPTTWDVLIALFGGLAGIVATASKERGNVIPGVAIATALMPPLCTAGYGIAMGSWKYFGGAFYLFSINAVFIWFATVVVIRFLRFQKVDFIMPRAKKRVRLLIGVFVVLMIIPSVYIARNLVLKSIFEEKVNRFINHEFNFPETHVFKHSQQFKPESKITVTLFGQTLDENTIQKITNQLPVYGLHGARLMIKQGNNDFNVEGTKAGILEEVLSRNLDSLSQKEQALRKLSAELESIKKSEIQTERVFEEAKVMFNDLQQFSIKSTTFYSTDKSTPDTLYFAFAKFRTKQRRNTILQFEDWLKVRIPTDSLKLITEP